MTSIKSKEAFDRWLLQTSEDWDDVLNVVRLTGFSMIDNDHKQLIKYILRLNQIIDLIDEKKIDLETLAIEKKLFKDFLGYTKYHFSTEEKILERYEMDALEVQREQHSIIIGKITEALEQFEAGKLMMSTEIKVELLNWVIDHINNIDCDAFRLTNFKQAFSSAKSWDEIAILVEQTGLSFVDQEHREITSRLFNFFDKYTTGEESTSHMYDDLNSILQLFMQHFEHEESFIIKNNLENLEIQRASHTYFIKRIGEIKDMLREEQLSGIDEIKVEVLVWWVGHINGIDNRTFSIREWSTDLFEKATSPEDIYWLIERTGISDIDNAHRDFVKKSFEIFELIKEEADQPMIYSKFAELYKIVDDHFRTEEKLMEKMPQDSVINHLAEHKRLMGIFDSTLVHLKHDRFVFDNRFKTKVIEWWLHHTNYIDTLTFGLEREDE